MKFEFTTEEANIILNAVAQLPFTTAKPIIEKMQEQAKYQSEEKSEDE